MTPIIVVHGGAGTLADGSVADAERGVGIAATAGHAILRSGGSAIDAVVAAVRSLEDDPTFNAGRGACMNAQGEFEVDAGIMFADPDDSAPRHGAIAAVPDLCDAIVVARLVLERSPHALLCAAGAVALAREHSIGRFDRDGLWTAKAQARWEAARAGASDATGQADTVGAVAIDARGRVCAGNSTGGVLGKARGRIGDSPLVGVGFYADAQLGAACATGVGEAIMTRVAAYAVLQRIAAGEDPDAAALAICEAAAGSTATCGLIVVTPQGRAVVQHASRHMSWASAADGQPLRTGVTR